MTEERAVDELIRTWVDAVRAGDLDAVLDHHARDIVMFDVPPPEQGVRGLDEYRATWPPFFEWVRAGEFELESLTVTAGHDVAYAWALLRCGRPEDFEARPDQRLRLTVGLRREDDAWTVAHEHHSFTHSPPSPVPTPGTGVPETAGRFAPILGRWRTDGRVVDDGTPITGWDTYELAPGGCFVVHHVDVHVGEQAVQAVEIIGEGGPDGSLLARAYDADGAVTVMHVAVDDGAFLFTGGADVAPAAGGDPAPGARGAVRSTLTVAPDGASMHALWERTDDGDRWTDWMDVDFSRAAAPE